MDGYAQVRNIFDLGTLDASQNTIATHTLYKHGRLDFFLDRKNDNNVFKVDKRRLWSLLGIK